MAYTELVANWSGTLSGMPGYSKFRFIGELSPAQVNSAAANINTFFNAVKGSIPAAVTITVGASATFHTDAGVLTAEVPVTSPPAPLSMTGTSGTSSTSGILVRWITGAINGGHKVEGRTYLVPVSVNALATGGDIAVSNRAIVQAAATAFATSTPSPAINSRSGGKPGRGDQTVAVSSALVSAKQVVLRSRRD